MIASLSEVYTYDSLNQLASYKLGTLKGTKTDVTGSPTTTPSWDYDAVGNWDSITTNSTTQTRTANKQNENTAVSGATTPAYDSNGNLTTDENNYRFVYDAWNKVAQVKNSSNVVVVTYGRDALHRHVTDTVGSTITDRFFSSDWQLLETKVGSNTVTRNVWSPVYVDGLVLRDRDTDANGTLDERLYALQDANWNTTALVNTTGTVQERYTYTPFGQVTFRDASGSTLSGSAKDWIFLHQGGEKIAANDYEFRNRLYSPTLGRWLSNDPLGFEAGDQNWYRAIGNNPGNGLDPSGLDEWWFWSDPLYLLPGREQNVWWDTWKTLNPTRSKRYLESKIRTASDGPLTIGHGVDQSFFDGVQQVGPEMLDKVAEKAAEKAAGMVVIGAAGIVGKNIVTAGKVAKGISKQPYIIDPAKGFKTYDEFKKRYGPAGNKKAWHHIVEQKVNKDRIPSEIIHNPGNIIILPHGPGSIHEKISAHYSRKFEWTNGLKLRDWLAKKSFEEQFEYGVDIIKQFGGSEFLPKSLQ